MLRNGRARRSAVALPYVMRSANAQAAPTSARTSRRRSTGGRSRASRSPSRSFPASYFDNLIAIAPQFEALTGVKVRFEKVPPGQIRQKAMLDLSSKTGTYATSRDRPDVLPALRRQQVGRAARPVPERYARSPTPPGSTTTTSSRRGATPIRRRQAVRHSVRRRGHGAGLSQGPVRREGAQARRDARRFREERAGGARSEQPRVGRGAARLRRRRAEHVHLSLDLPQLRRRLVQGEQDRRQHGRRRSRARLVRGRALQVRAAGGAQLELARYRRRVLAGHARRLH